MHNNLLNLKIPTSGQRKPANFVSIWRPIFEGPSKLIFLVGMI